MIGQLQIFYKNGEIRNIGLDVLFFRETKVSIATRALDIAHSHNPEPWKIFVYKDVDLRFEKIIGKNEPNPLTVITDHIANLADKVLRRSIIKRFKRELKVAA